MTGTVFNIQHFTIHDGPGIRTEVFMKGCPMHCRWCSNPEGSDADIQLGVFRKKCLGKSACGVCLDACPQTMDKPLEFYRGRIRSIDRSLCTGCMACAEACPSLALRIWGREVTTEEVMKEVLRDRGYYERSGGGITVSGGEPLVQADFVAELLAKCRQEGIHTCCESCLCVDRKEIEKAVPVTDLWIADIKIMEDEKHRQYTGESNARILENLKYLADIAARRIILRIPVIPGVNDDMDNMEKTADFITDEMGGRILSLQLLSFMRLGQEKYESLGMAYGMDGVRFRRDHFQKKIQRFADHFNSRGIKTTVGTREKK